MNTLVGSKTRFWIFTAALSVLAACAQGPSVRQESVLYPELPQEPRIQFLTNIVNEDSLTGKKASSFQEFLVGRQEEAGGQHIGRPFALAHVPGYLIVLDKARNGLLQIDLETGEFEPIFDPRGGMLKDPQSIFVDDDSLLYLVDSARHEILVFNENLGFEQSYDTGEGTRPIDVAVGQDRIFVTEINGSEILVLDKATGETIERWGGLGHEEGLFDRMTNLTLDEEENLYVVDFLNFRFQMFDSTGEFVRSFGSNMRFFGGVIRPKGLDVDREGNVYLADAAFEMVTIWDSETGTPRMPFGYSDVRNPEQLGGLYLPTDVDIDYDNVAYFQKYADPDFDLQYIVYVSNGERAISVYGFGKWTGSLTARKRSRAATDDGSDDDQSSISGLEEIEGMEEPQ